MDALTAITQSLHGLPQMVAGLLGAGGLYKLIEKLLDNRDKAAAREAVHDGERAKADADRLRELEKMLIPLAQKAAEAEWLAKENARVEEENKTLRSVLHDSEIERIQALTVANGYKVFADLFSDDVGIAFLKARMEAKRESREFE